MKIVLASSSAVKVEACRRAFANVAGVEICPVKVAKDENVDVRYVARMIDQTFEIR